MTRNLRQAVRSLKKSPGFALVAILILTVAIGSNLAVFSTIDAFLLRPLPVERPQELVRICPISEHGRVGQFPSTILDGLKQDRAFQGVCGVNTSLLPAEINGSLRSIGVAGFSGSCFETLGIGLQAGRGIHEQDDRLGGPEVAVITDALWRGQFGGRPDILGKPLMVNGELFTIVGVTEKRFPGVLVGFPQDVMAPLLEMPVQLPNGRKPTSYAVNVLARRAKGVSERQALASVAAQRAELLEQSVPQRFNAAQRKEYLAQKVTVIPGKTGVDYFLRNRFGEPLWAIFGVCAAMLLAGCVNLASLLLARSLNRRREVTVRLALGAKRRDIVGILLLENALLALAGGGLGAVVGMATARTMLAAGAQMFSNFSIETRWDAHTMWFLAGALGLVLGIFGAAALWQAGRLSRLGALQESGRGVIRTSNFAQKALAGVQIALTLALVAGSALFGASLKHMYGIDFGIKPQSTWEALLSARPGGYRNFAPVAYYRDLLQRVEAMPNVVSATFSNAIPFLNAGYEERVAVVENGQPGREVTARVLGVSDRFFETLGAKAVTGEDFRQKDDHSGEPAVILSRRLAQYLAEHDPGAKQSANANALIGRHVRVGDDADYQHLQVRGVAPDVDLSLVNLEDTKPFTVYVNFWQHRHLQAYPVLLIRTKGDALAAATIRRLVDEGGREYVERFTSIGQEIDNALVENRVVAYLCGAFGALALVMAAVGLFGLLSYQVTSRTSEIGVRMALGARRLQIQRLVLRQIMGLLAAGSIAGIALTFAIERVIGGLLYGVQAGSMPVLGFAIGVLTLTAVMAAWLPVRRASGIDPVEALRHE